MPILIKNLIYLEPFKLDKRRQKERKYHRKLIIIMMAYYSFA